MADKYATTDFQHALTDIKGMKRAILFFDKIYVMDLDSIDTEFIQTYAKSYQLANLEYLIENDLIENIELSPVTTSVEDGSFQLGFTASRRIQMNNYHSDIISMSLYSRAASIVLNSQGKDAVPLIWPKDLQIDIKNKNNFQTTAIITVMNHFPLISDEMPISDIVQFKNESETKHKLLRLRNWYRKWEANTSENEIVEEAEMLVHDYKRYMDACGVSYKIGVVESAISLPIEIVKGLVTINPKKITSAILSIKKAKVILLKEEADAPGKELSFIASVMKE